MNDYYFNLPMPDEHQRPEQIRQLLQKARKENALQVGGYVCCWIMCGAAAIGVGGWVRVCVCVCVCVLLLMLLPKHAKQMQQVLIIALLLCPFLNLLKFA